VPSGPESIDRDSLHGLSLAELLPEEPRVKLQLNIVEQRGKQSILNEQLSELKMQLSAQADHKQQLLQRIDELQAQVCQPWAAKVGSVGGRFNLQGSLGLDNRLNATRQVLRRVHQRGALLGLQAAGKERECERLGTELAGMAEAAAKAQRRVSVLEGEVAALAAQAEQAGLELGEAQEVWSRPASGRSIPSQGVLRTVPDITHTGGIVNWSEEPQKGLVGRMSALLLIAIAF
jgi:hypothetical protein